MGSKMPQYFFRIRNGRYSGASDQGTEFESREAAWTEMTKVCANLVGGISRSLKQSAEWHMELLDEAKSPYSESVWCRKRSGRAYGRADIPGCRFKPHRVTISMIGGRSQICSGRARSARPRPLHIPRLVKSTEIGGLNR